jgi:hypothetical protein
MIILLSTKIQMVLALHVFVSIADSSTHHGQEYFSFENLWSKTTPGPDKRWVLFTRAIHRSPLAEISLTAR